VGALGGTRGVIGILLASGAVALPIGLVLGDLAGRSGWLDPSYVPARIAVVAIIWAFLIVWALSGTRPTR